MSEFLPEASPIKPSDNPGVIAWWLKTNLEPPSVMTVSTATKAKCPCTLEHHRILISRTIQSYFGQVSLTMVRSVTVK